MKPVAMTKEYLDNIFNIIFRYIIKIDTNFYTFSHIVVHFCCVFSVRMDGVEGESVFEGIIR